MAFSDKWREFWMLPAKEQPKDTLTPMTDGELPYLDLSARHSVRYSIDRFGAWASSDFMACETVKARAIRSLPVHIVKRTETGRVPVDDHPFSRLLLRPNPLMTWGDLMAWAVLRRDTMGTAYIRVQRDAMYKPVALWPVLSHVDVDYDKGTGLVVYHADEDKLNPAWRCREDGVIVIKTDTTKNGVRGISIAETAAEDIGLSVDLGRFYQSLVSDGQSFQGWLEHPGKLDPTDVDAIRASLHAQNAEDGPGGIRVFDRGLKYHQVALTVSDMNLVEQERFVLEKICRATHVPMHHVQADAGASATAATGADIDFVKNCVLPEITAIEAAFQPALDGSPSIGGKDVGYRVKFDTNGLLRGDFTTRMEGYRIGVYAGIFTRAYCCTQEDIPWLPGQDKLMQPTAYYLLDENGVPYMPAPATEGTSGQSDGVSGIDPKEVGARLRPFVTDAMARIEKRAAADGDTEKTRDFAATVCAPIYEAAALAGEFLDLSADIDTAIETGANNA